MTDSTTREEGLAITSLQELLEVLGFEPAAVITPAPIFASDYFLIRSAGLLDESAAHLEVVVDRSDGFPRRHDTNGRLTALHDPNLHGRGLAAEQGVFVDIKIVQRIPRRVRFGDIQRFEIVVFILHFRTITDFKSHSTENLQQIINGLGN